MTADPSRADRRAARRAEERRKRSESPLLKIPFRQPRNALRPLELLSPDQIEQLHAASLRILEDIGLDFNDEETLDLLTKTAGSRAAVAHVKRVAELTHAHPAA